MGLARWQTRRRGPDHYHPQSRQSNLARPLPNLRQRRLGTRLLSEIQQPPSGISRRLVERRQLGRNQPPLRGLQSGQISRRPSHGKINKSLWRGVAMPVWVGHSCPTAFDVELEFDLLKVIGKTMRGHQKSPEKISGLFLSLPAAP